MLLLTERERMETSPQEVLVKWWQEHASEIFIYMLSRVRDEEIAWELYQDSFIKAYSHLRKGKTHFESEDKLRRWLLKVMRSVVSDHFRREKLRKIVFVGSLLEILRARSEHTPPPEIVLAKREKLRSLLSVMKDLRDLEREVITLKLLMGLKFKEISEVLRKPIGTCITAYNRGIKKLERMLQEGGESL